MQSVSKISTIRSLGFLNIAAAAVYAFASVGSTGAKAQTPPTNSVTCSAPTTTSGGTPKGLISADTPVSNGVRMFPLSASFTIQFVTKAPASDRVNWSVQDYQGNIRGSGSFAVPAGAQTSKITCTSSASGYFALTGTLNNAGGTLPKAGTRPAGIATFGVLPSVSWALPAATYTSQEQHRFGMQGESDKPALLNALGVTQAIDWRQLSNMEPFRANSWNPTAAQSVANVDSLFKTGEIARLVRLDGVPAWASPTGAVVQDSYAPKDLNYFQGYMARVGADTEAIRKTYFPNMKNNYYQVTWEPSWAESPSSFVAMYKAVYQGVHSTDPHAVVMGVTSPDPGTAGDFGTGQWLKTYAPLGLQNYIDGITTHSYWANHDSPSFPPEKYDSNPSTYYQSLAINHQMRNLRAKMQNFKPTMRLWSTE